MALDNREKQQRWRERHILRRRTVQRIASLLLRQRLEDPHFEELGNLLRLLIPSQSIAALRRALKPPTDREIVVHSEAKEVAILHAWLRAHPGRTRAEYMRLLRNFDSDVWRWRRKLG